MRPNFKLHWNHRILYARHPGSLRWTFIGGVTYIPIEWPQWFWGWLMPKRWYASYHQGKIRSFRTLAEAMRFVESGVEEAFISDEVYQ